MSMSFWMSGRSQYTSSMYLYCVAEARRRVSAVTNTVRSALNLLDEGTRAIFLLHGKFRDHSMNVANKHKTELKHRHEATA